MEKFYLNVPWLNWMWNCYHFQGKSLEKRYGSVYMAFLIASFAVMCNAVTVGLAIVAEEITGDPSYLSTCAAGFSGRGAYSISAWILDINCKLTFTSTLYWYFFSLLQVWFLHWRLSQLTCSRPVQRISWVLCRLILVMRVGRSFWSSNSWCPMPHSSDTLLAS